jgi:hypothetical protein
VFDNVWKEQYFRKNVGTIIFALYARLSVLIVISLQKMHGIVVVRKRRARASVASEKKIKTTGKCFKSKICCNKH